MRRYRRLLLAALLAVPMLYAVAGLIGGALPAGGAPRPERGVRIYVEDNGIHTGIVLPAAALDGIVRPEHFRDPRYAGWGWRSVGWGDRAFYEGTQTWWDVNPLTVLRAAIGSDATVMHVDAVPEPVPGPHVRAVMLTEVEYARLIAHVRASFATGAPKHGYGDYDAFYRAHGRYSGVETCNTWAGTALRRAGVRMGAWTPFPVTVMWWL